MLVRGRTCAMATAAESADTLTVLYLGRRWHENKGMLVTAADDCAQITAVRRGYLAGEEKTLPEEVSSF